MEDKYNELDEEIEFFVPVGKTRVTLKDDIPRTAIRKGDVGYIDGYVFNGRDNGTMAIFVRCDGYFQLVDLYEITAYATDDEKKQISK